jgi:hypothetical protein
MQRQPIRADLDIPQRRTVFGGEELLILGCKEGDPFQHPAVLRWPVRQSYTGIPVGVAVATGDINGLILAGPFRCITHEACAGVAVDTAHAGPVMDIRWAVFDKTSIGKPCEPVA